MEPEFFESHCLPDGVHACLVPGERSCSILINARSSVAEIAGALTGLIAPWAREEWMYVGEMVTPRLRTLG